MVWRHQPPWQGRAPGTESCLIRFGSGVVDRIEFAARDSGPPVTLASLALLLVLGAFVGVASGLLGIGGGLLMVPVLYFMMEGAVWSGLAVPLEHHAAMAHATSLAVIVPTAAAGLRAFWRMGVVPWSVAVPLGLAAAVAASFGAVVAVSLPTVLLKLLFGIFLLATSARLLGRRRRQHETEIGRTGLGPVRGLVGGGAVGFLSALLGIGGGIVAVPVLIRWAGLELGKVVPASIAIILFAAPAGVLAYAVAGSATAGLPPGSLGYVHVPSVLAMAPGAILCAPFGARINQRISGEGLRLLFGWVLLLMGVYLAGSNALQLLP
jgi:uncharacterized protein